MELKNILLDADAVSTNAQALLTDLGDLSVTKKYAHLMQLTKAAEAAMESIKPTIVEANLDIITAANAVDKDGGEFFADGLCFGLTQKYDYNWAANDIQEAYQKEDGTYATRNKYANLLREQADLKKSQELKTKQIKLCKAEIQAAHPQMQKTNISYTLSYKGRTDERKKEDNIIDANL